VWGHRVGDGLLGDLVEDHPLDRDLRLEDVQQVPGDGLPLAVAIGGEQEFVGVLQQALELADRGALVRGDDVDGGEVVLDVDAGARPRLALELGRNLGGAGREVSDMALTGPNDISRAQIAGDHGRLVGRLDDHQSLGGCHLNLPVGRRASRLVASPALRGAVRHVYNPMTRSR
jgi:hypothetical protein